MINQLISGRITSVGDGIAYILSTLVVIFLTLPIHEFAHGFAASKLGDPTPRYQGRLTLNPLAHIDYIGAACILLGRLRMGKARRRKSNLFQAPEARYGDYRACRAGI